MAPRRRRTLAALALLACAATSACGESGGASKSRYSVADIRSAYYKAADAGPGAPVREYWVDLDYHSHQNYVPLGGLETCPLAQRSNAPESGAPNMIEPTAAEPVQPFVVAPTEAYEVLKPKITQGALVFGTSTIAGNGMERFSSAMTRCPTSYDVRGGPSPILGTYAVSARPFEASGWKGYVQQIAHTYPADDVYYEDMAHVVLRRANVILYVDVDQKRVIGQRSDATAKASAVLKTVLKRLG